MSRPLLVIRGSWRLLRQDLELLVIPIISFMVWAGVVAGIAACGVVSCSSGWFFWLFPILVVAQFGSLLCRAAVVAAATSRMDGVDPTLGSAFGTAWSKRGLLARWVFYNMGVGLLMGAGHGVLKGLFGWLGDLAGRGAEIAWDVLTFFAVPVLLFEPIYTAAEARRRSVQMVKKHFGPQLSGYARMFGLTVLIPMLALLSGLTIYLLELGWTTPLAIVIWLVGIPLPVVIGSTMSSVFNAALYRFATTGDASILFGGPALQEAIRSRA